MPYLHMAAVVRWKVIDPGKVVHDTTTPIPLVVQDTGNPDSRIIAAYMQQRVDAGEDPKQLLKHAQDGLLTVVLTGKFEVTAPPLPANWKP